MKKILVVAATKKEVDPLIDCLGLIQIRRDFFSLSDDKCTINLLLTGVGICATAFSLGRTLLADYDLVINVGIAGCFDKSVELGAVLNVTHDSFADFGAEDGSKFLSAFDIPLLNRNDFPFVDGLLPATKLANNRTFSSLRGVRGITVNKVHGNDSSIMELQQSFPDVSIESMEGAAFIYSCLMVELSCIQLRSISNYVEKRNKENWKITLAVDNLNRVLMQLLEELKA